MAAKPGLNYQGTLLQATITDNDNSEQISQWVVAAQAGDKVAFSQLYQTYYKRLYLYCRRLTGDTGAAEEVVQDSFIKAWTALTQLNNYAGFYAWLRQIASRLAIDKSRLKASKVWQNSTAFDDNDFATRLNMESKLDLEKMIVLLPTGARSILVMHDIEGYGHREISQMLGVAEGTSKAQLARARSLLRQHFTDADSNGLERNGER